MNEKELYASLYHHLKYNHFPPIHTDFIDSAIEAIEAIEFDGLEYTGMETLITLPNEKVLTASEIIKGLHLTDYIDYIYNDLNEL